MQLIRCSVQDGGDDGQVKVYAQDVSIHCWNSSVVLLVSCVENLSCGILT